MLVLHSLQQMALTLNGYLGNERTSGTHFWPSDYSVSAVKIKISALFYQTGPRISKYISFYAPEIFVWLTYEID